MNQKETTVVELEKKLQFLKSNIENDVASINSLVTKTKQPDMPLFMGLVILSDEDIKPVLEKNPPLYIITKANLYLYSIKGQAPTKLELKGNIKNIPYLVEYLNIQDKTYIEQLSKNQKRLIEVATENPLPLHEGLTLSNFEEFSKKLKKFYFDSSVNLYGEHKINQDEIIQEPAQFFLQIRGALDLIKKEKNENEKAVFYNIHWGRAVEKIKLLFNKNTPIKTDTDFLSFFEKVIDITSVRDEIAYKNLIDIISKKIKQLENQVQVSQLLENIKLNLENIAKLNKEILEQKINDLSIKIVNLSKDFENLIPKVKENYTPEELENMADKYYEYITKIEFLKKEEQSLGENESKPFGFIDEYSLLEPNQKTCKKNLSTAISKALNQIKESLENLVLTEDTSDNELKIKENSQIYKKIVNNVFIARHINFDEALKNAYKELGNKLKECKEQNEQLKKNNIPKEPEPEKNNQEEPKNEPKHHQDVPNNQNNKPKPQVDHEQVLKKIKTLLNSEDWAKTKKCTLFASKPTSVRRMLAIIKNTASQEAASTLVELKNFLDNRSDDRGLVKTNVNAKGFYVNLKNILNDLENKNNALDDLRVISIKQLH